MFQLMDVEPSPHDGLFSEHQQGAMGTVLPLPPHPPLALHPLPSTFWHHPHSLFHLPLAAPGTGAGRPLPEPHLSRPRAPAPPPAEDGLASRSRRESVPQLLNMHLVNHTTWNLVHAVHVFTVNFTMGEEIKQRRTQSRMPRHQGDVQVATIGRSRRRGK